MTVSRPFILILALLGIAGSIFYLESLKVRVSSVSDALILEQDFEAGNPMPMPVETEDARKSRIAAKSLIYPRAFDISTPDGFINSEDFRLSDLLGKKVILLDFWTYSCINCQRTLPYLNSWHEKYSDKGLVIVGIHTPEFEFEKKYENVLSAAEKFGIKYPIVLDNDYSTWTSYRNQYWPRKYLIDIEGFVVYDHIGEGGYEETERRIQEVLGERGEILGTNGDVISSLRETPVSKEIFYTLPNSPEVYFGAFRNNLLGNGASQIIGIQKFDIPGDIKNNTLYLSGDWNISREYAQNITEEAKIVFKYRAKDIYMVASADKEVHIQVLRDGKPVGNAAGEDLDAAGSGIIREDRLYKLIQDQGDQAEHVIEIIIKNPGLKAFTFTFG